ncbi:hypothetical protein JD969_06275 [Planctomycetota bacterium]|nr:hypothetical protein JD969_06275 [Planctomycetota bacterium]
MKLQWLISLSAVLLMNVATFAAEQSKWNLEGKGPHLIAHYMPWFEVYPQGQQANKHWRHWRWDDQAHRRDPNTRLDSGQRQISSVHYPLVGPYNSWDRSIARYHLKTAKAAGVQAFVVIWYGKDTPDSDAQIPMLLDEAQKLGMKIAICYEEKINWPHYRKPKSREDIIKTAAEDLNYLINSYGTHDAYLKREGKPFIMQFNFWGEDDLGPRQILADEWKQIFSKLDGEVYYCRQNMDRADVHGPIQSAFMWFKPNHEHWDQDFKYFSQTADWLKKEKRLDFFMTVVCPGFDSTGVWGWGGGPRVLDRNGTDILEYTMSRALEGEPELVQIMTWNDWEEGTAVEPSRDFGFTYVDTIEKWWGDVTGREVNLEDNRQGFEGLLGELSEFQSDELPESVRAKYLGPDKN